MHDYIHDRFGGIYIMCVCGVREKKERIDQRVENEGVSGLLGAKEMEKGIYAFQSGKATGLPS